MEGNFGPDCWLSGTPDVPDALSPAEAYLAGILSPDQREQEGLPDAEAGVAIGGLDRIELIDPSRPELGWQMKEQQV